MNAESSRPAAAKATRPTSSRDRRDRGSRKRRARGCDPASGTAGTAGEVIPSGASVISWEVSFLGKPEGVADAAHGMDQRPPVDVDLLAQVADVGLEHAGVTTEVVIPDVVEQLRAGEHFARVGQQVAQQPVLGGG